MAHRPQFSVPNPDPDCSCDPEVFEFDGTNTPGLKVIALNVGDELRDVPLVLDQDGDFLLLGMRIVCTSGVDVLIRDPWTNPLMDDYVPPTLYADFNFVTSDEPGIYCPSGAVFLLSLKRVS